MKVSVVLPTLNEEKVIERTLKSLTNQTLSRKKYEIIVIDGKSTDKTVKIARKYADRVFVGKYKPIGFARDVGLRKAKGEIIACVDADTIYSKDWLDKIVKKMKDKKIVGVYGPIRFIEKGILEFILTIGAYFIFYATCLFAPSPGGYNMAVRKKDAIKIGGFSHTNMGEDNKIMRDLFKKGKTIFVPDLKIKTSSRRFRKSPMSIVYNWALKPFLKALKIDRIFNKMFEYKSIR